MSTGEEKHTSADEPGPGDLAKDTEHDRLGVVVGRSDTSVRLRSLAGAEQWEADPSNVRHLRPREELSARLTMLNSGRRWGK